MLEILNLYREVAEPLQGKFAHHIKDYHLTPEQRERIINFRSGYSTRSRERLLGVRWLPTSEALLRLKLNLSPDARLSRNIIFEEELSTDIARMVESYYKRHRVVRAIEFARALTVLNQIGVIDS